MKAAQLLALAALAPAALVAQTRADSVNVLVEAARSFDSPNGRNGILRPVLCDGSFFPCVARAEATAADLGAELADSLDLPLLPPPGEPPTCAASGGGDSASGLLLELSVPVFNSDTATISVARSCAELDRGRPSLFLESRKLLLRFTRDGWRVVEILWTVIS